MPLASDSIEPEHGTANGYWMGYDIGVVHGRTDAMRRVVEGLAFQRFGLPSSGEEALVNVVTLGDLERFYQRVSLRSVTCWAELLAD